MACSWCAPVVIGFPLFVFTHPCGFANVARIVRWTNICYFNNDAGSRAQACFGVCTSDLKSPATHPSWIGDPVNKTSRTPFSTITRIAATFTIPFFAFRVFYSAAAFVTSPEGCSIGRSAAVFIFFKFLTVFYFLIVPRVSFGTTSGSASLCNAVMCRCAVKCFSSSDAKKHINAGAS